VKFVSYPSIVQYRNIVHSLKLRAQYAGKDENEHPIYDESLPLPKLEFKGTVKLHGTNAGISQCGDNIWFQSRENIITPEKDNAGFATAFSHSETLKYLQGLFESIRNIKEISEKSILTIFGEWCGKGIQKGVALNQIDKRFVVFGLKESNEDEEGIWHDHKYIGDLRYNIFNINDYKEYQITIDLARPQDAIPEIERFTDEVESECPFAKAFGVSGLGEGIVWTTKLEDGTIHRFKSKGEKHKIVVSKERTPIDVEKQKSVDDFVNYAVTEERLNQGVEQVFTVKSLIPEAKHTGDFLKWLVADIIKEELDTMVQSGLNTKDCNGAISKAGREWFFKYLDRRIFEENT
jgi:hypothetical protein